MTDNTNVHAYFILFVVICLSEPTEAPSVLPARDKKLDRASNGLQHLQYGAAKLGTAKWLDYQHPFSKMIDF